MTGQGIRELRPSEVLGVPVVELWSDCVRLVHATNGEVDQAGDVRCGERNRCAADLTEAPLRRSEEHTSELQSLMRISYAVFCLKKKNHKQHNQLYKYIT